MELSTAWVKRGEGEGTDGTYEFFLMALPQLDTHVFAKPSFLLPGPPPSGAWMSQCAGKTPQKPQLLQQAFSGQGLRSAIVEFPAGNCVPGTSGPHSAPACGGGRPAFPSLIHIL